MIESNEAFIVLRKADEPKIEYHRGRAIRRTQYVVQCRRCGQEKTLTHGEIVQNSSCGCGRGERRTQLFDGKTIRELAIENGIQPSTLRQRVRTGMSIEEAIATPVRTRDVSNVAHGERFSGKTIAQWSDETGLSYAVIYRRLKIENLSLEEAIRPLDRRGKAPQVYNGKTLSQWSAESGINTTTLNERIKRGMSIEEAVSQPVQVSRRRGREYDGRTIDEWAETWNISPAKIRYRLKQGWSLKKIEQHYEVRR